MPLIWEKKTPIPMTPEDLLLLMGKALGRTTPQTKTKMTQCVFRKQAFQVQCNELEKVKNKALVHYYSGKKAAGTFDLTSNL